VCGQRCVEADLAAGAAVASDVRDDLSADHVGQHGVSSSGFAGVADEDHGVGFGV